MRRTLVLGIVIAFAAVGIAEQDIEARIDKLLGRWTRGDKATRAGVVAETHALGERAIADLYRRLAKNSFEFPANELGARFSSVNLVPDPKRTVLVETSFVTPGADARLPDRPTLITAEQADRIAKGGKVLTAPSIVCYDGQRANVQITNQKTYTRTFDPRRQAVEGTVHSGISLEIRPRLIEGTKTLSLEVRSIRAVLDGETVPTLKTAEGEVGIPIVTKREIAVTLTIESGESAAVVLPGKEPVMLRLKVTRLEESPIENK